MALPIQNRNEDGINFANISATTATFQLFGGYYNANAVATWGGGSAKLNFLLADGATFIEYDSSNSSFSANGTHLVYLPPGTYKWVIATATGVYLQLTRIPIN